MSELGRGRVPLLDLTVSNPTQALANYPHVEIAAALGAIPDFLYQPEAFGSRNARAAIAQYMQNRLPGICIQAEHVALTASTSEAYGILFKLLGNPGDEVFVPVPSYPLFEYLAQLEGLILKPYNLAYDGSWYIDFASLESAITPRSRAIILVNPNNPTGSFLKVPELPVCRTLPSPIPCRLSQMKSSRITPSATRPSGSPLWRPPRDPQLHVEWAF